MPICTGGIAGERVFDVCCKNLGNSVGGRAIEVAPRMAVSGRVLRAFAGVSSGATGKIPGCRGGGAFFGVAYLLDLASTIWSSLTSISGFGQAL